VPATFRVEVTAYAKADIAEIWEYIAQESPEKATVLILALEEEITSLQQVPERCPRIPENEILGTSYRHLLRGPYRAIFRVTGSSVVVLRVIHGARLLDTSFLAQ